jgi:hypothetical protein
VAGDVELGSTTSDVEDDAAGGTGATTADDDGLAELDDTAAELGTTGSGDVDVMTGTSGASLGSGVGITVVKDVMMTTGGTCRDSDGEAWTGKFVLDGTGSWA